MYTNWRCCVHPFVVAHYNTNKSHTTDPPNHDEIVRMLYMFQIDDSHGDFHNNSRAYLKEKKKSSTVQCVEHFYIF